ncbi:hypothetical protein AU468_02735 [Alkalispirochaeta sphaeroplastigenens]|uniref:Uncharacterized protein n=1 Tax=Alkalispirochaeta sphaeroplastigenens TaxID=1187066 RepID=A0A2S4JYZ7_9SPIO|nr:hypothetical protein [Alkalispirochaeta sphaeroplastigenens]POR04747.1 hypothetical protein AU468_02735 [Alkalispirochaeta sphaeroplastigenens]
MGAILRILLLGLGAIALALVVPRAAGEELRVRLLWDQDLSQEMVILSNSGGWASGSAVFAVGANTLGSFAREDGSILSGAIRHRSFSQSGNYYINQAGTIADRWAVMDGRTGSVSFHERQGLPRLYGPVLAQFGAREILLRDSRFGGTVSLPRREALSTFDALPGGDDGERPAFAVMGDIFGEVSLHRIDLSRAAEDEAEERYRLPSAEGPVFGVKLLPGEPPFVVVVRGLDPQVVELFRYGTAVPLLREEVHSDNAVEEPLVFHELDQSQVMVALRDSVLLVDVHEKTLRYSTVSATGAVAATVSGERGDLLVATARDQGLSLALWTLAGFDRPREDRRGPLTWSLPGARLAASTENLLVLERKDRFFAFEVAP